MSTRTTSRALLLLASLSLSFAAGCGGAVDSPSNGSSSGTPAASTLPPPDSVPPPGMTTAGGPPPPAPIAGSWSTTASGCANFVVYASHTSGRRYLVVQATKDKLGIAALGDTVTIDLASKSASFAAAVYADTLPKAPAEATYCSDVIIDPQEPQRSTATEGKVTFTISSVGREGDSYAVTVKLEGVVVRNGFGNPETIPDVTYSAVGVGWLPG
jgi:hypothetical protein